MKSRLPALILILLCLAFSASSQVWIRPNAVWHYDYIGLGSHGYLTLSYEDDSLIDGHLCQHLHGELYEIFATGPGQYGDMTSPYGDWYTFVNGDTVF